MHFAKLDDSPMFRKQIQSLEESAESLRERSLKFYKGCRKYTEGLGEEYDGDIAFVGALETFGGGHDDPISLAFGGPVMTKFTIALREIGTYKELLRSQVEHMMNDRLLQFVNIDLHEVKEARKRFDKASIVYDQARERFLSLRKGTKTEVAIGLEEELHNARSTFEQARFNLITALSNVEAKKRFEFLEAVSGTMDAHLRYFKQGYELLHQMEPYINQVLTYAQQSRERSNYEQAALSERMQDYKRQVDRESRWSSYGTNRSPNGDGIQAIGRSSHKMIEAVMQSAANGKIQTIRQGYLSKRSSNLRGDWKRRFFVLDSRGMLYYYRKQCSKPSASSSQISGQRHSSELGSGLLSRWLSSHYHGGGVHDEKSVARHTVNLLTSTIKVDADQSDLRFCFRIISPTKNYTLQAESALDQKDWIEKITGVIASLLSSQAPEMCPSAGPMGISHHRSASESSSFESSDFDHCTVEEYTSERSLATAHHERPIRNMQPQRSCIKSEKLTDVLRRVCGNDKCADCGAPEPDWASLNLGVLVCIECSGVHRNLGVHISKVRSLTLDVKVWDTSVISLFQSLGNTFANSVWEELLQSRSGFQLDLVPVGLYKSDKSQLIFLCKPSHTDSISVKEKFIHAKYAEKLFVRKSKDKQYPHLVAQQIWEGVRANDKKAVYRHIVNSEADVNVAYKQTSCESSLAGDSMERSFTSSTNLAGTSEALSLEDLDGCTLLHLACETADIGMIELLLQYGANVNATPTQSLAILGKMMRSSANLLLSIPVLLLFSLFFISSLHAATFEIRNECPYTVWAAASPGGGRRLDRGQTWTLNVAAGTAMARIWGRTNCNFDASGRGHCQTGDCGVLECKGWGVPPNTLAEYALNQFGNMDFIDISLVDGFNIPMDFSPTTGRCRGITCTADINGQCPGELRTPGGCNNPCTVFKTNEYCCTNGYGSCGPTNFSKFFKSRCPDAYSYPQDDPTSTFTCPGGTNYKVVFCPKRSPRFPLEMVGGMSEE